MPAQQREPQPNQPGPQRQPPPNLWFWWLILGGLLIWNLIAWWPQAPSDIANIPYSVFIGQVKADNVAKVYISDSTITGQFVKPMLWPEKNARPETKAAPAPANQPPAAVQSNEAPAPASANKTVGAPSRPAAAVADPPDTANKAGQPPKPEYYHRFRTIFPSSVGDRTLLPLLEEHHVTVSASPPSSSWAAAIIAGWLPMLLLIGFFWWMATRAGRSQSGMFGFGRMKAKRYTSEQSKITFADVAGADEAKLELQEEVDFLRHPAKYHDLGASIPRGILLVGPPGTGKTLLARAVAGEAGVPFFSINASEFVEMFVGVGASRVRDLFRQAKEAAPAIVFIDELDAVGRRRGAGLGTVNDEREQTLNQLLGELDGFDPRTEVIIMAATNRPDVLDPALLRPGRFDRQVMVGLPDKVGREGILRIHAHKLRLASDIDFGTLAGMTIGLSGADLANLCNEAALVAARHNRPAVTMADFEEAHDKIRLGAAQPQLMDPKERRIVAYHEAGHAIVAWLSPAADPVQKITIVPHGQALGVTEQVPGEERHNLSQSYLRARLAVMLGGRTSEELVIGEVTTGAENDLIEATKLARRMVTRWGMGKLGLVAYKSDGENPFLGYELSQRPDYSEATAAEIDLEVRDLLSQAHEEVRRLLMTARQSLDRLAATLLRDETVGADQLARILGPRAQPRIEGPDGALAAPVRT